MAKDDKVLPDEEAQATSFLAVVKYMRETRESLGARPSKADVSAAASEISSIISELDEEIIALASSDKVPEGATPGVGASALKAFKEDVARANAQMKLMPHLAVLDLDKRFRHYDRFIRAAEKSLLTGAWKTEEGQAALTEGLSQNAGEDGLPTSLLNLNLSSVFIPERTEGPPGTSTQRVAGYMLASQGAAAAAAAAAAGAAAPGAAAPSPSLSRAQSAYTSRGPAPGDAAPALDAGLPDSIPVAPREAPSPLAPAAAAGAAAAAATVAVAAAAGASSAKSHAAPELTSIPTSSPAAGRRAADDSDLSALADAVPPSPWLPAIKVTPEHAAEAAAVLAAVQQRRAAADIQNRPKPALGASQRRPAGAPGFSPLRPAASVSTKSQSSAAEEHPTIEINEVLLQIIADSVQSRPRVMDIRGHLFSSPLQYIPETLGLVDSLVELNVAENQLVVLPDSIGDLKNLTSLDASFNQLLELPRGIGQLTALRELDLHHNKLDEVPVTLGDCTNLEVLHLEFNQLRALPTAFGRLQKLRVLTVHLNQITLLPHTIGQMEELRELDAHHNQLQAVPESLGRCHQLTKLNVSANYFDLQYLPASLGQLSNLKELDIRENHIKNLPVSITCLTNLKVLKMEGNPWKVPPMEVVAKGGEAVMEFMAKESAKDTHGPRDGHSHRPSAGTSGLFRLFRGRKEDGDKLDQWKSHASTWGG